jgi:NADH-quinone oxidoreductase subunit G
VPWRPGRDTSGILAALADGELTGALVAGVEVADLPEPAAGLAALSAARFVVSLEVRASEVTALADVVLPVAPVVEKAGTFVNWEGRERPFPAALADTGAIPDVRVLSALADEFDVALGLPTVEVARSEFAELGRWDGPRAVVPATAGVEAASPGPGEAVLATWRLLLDAGRLQDGEPYLAATARTPVARLSATTAREAGVTDGGLLEVGTPHGSIVLPLEVTEMPDRVVWVPQNSPGCRVHLDLGAGAGTVVTVAAAPPDAVHPDRRSGGVG